MQPIKKYSAGNVSLSIWENRKEVNGKEVTMESVSLQRSFKDSKGEWQHLQSFRKSDLPNVMLTAQKAFEYLALKE